MNFMKLKELWIKTKRSILEILETEREIKKQLKSLELTVQDIEDDVDELWRKKE